MLVLVAGPSGAGKDSLLNGARDVFQGDPRIHFARRVITRPPDPDGENHESVTGAVFATRAIRANAQGFEADAQLTIRGQTRPVRLQFQVVKTSEGALRLTGTARLTRLAFGLGSGEFETTDWVGNDVEVRVVVVAHVR